MVCYSYMGLVFLITIGVLIIIGYNYATVPWTHAWRFTKLWNQAKSCMHAVCRWQQKIHADCIMEVHWFETESCCVQARCIAWGLNWRVLNIANRPSKLLTPWPLPRLQLNPHGVNWKVLGIYSPWHCAWRCYMEYSSITL